LIAKSAIAKELDMPFDFFNQTKMYRQREREWQNKYNPLAPKKGSKAPDFNLHDIKGENSVRLSDYWGKKPVALVFGSFT
jgi:hypothetical protein